MEHLRGAALVVTVVLGACASAGAEPTDTRAPPTTAGQAVIDAHYFYSGQQAEDEFVAIESSLAACMRNEGWDYVAEDLVSTFTAEEDGLELRRRQGFGFVASFVDGTEGVELQVGEPSPNRQIYLELSASHQEAYLESKRLCESAAMEDIGAQKEEYARSLPEEALDVLYAIETGDHPDLRVAQAAWAECIREDGWDASLRGELVSEVDAQVQELLAADDADAARELEIRAAVDDWECADRHIGPVLDELYERLGVVLEEYEVGLPTYTTREE